MRAVPTSTASTHPAAFYTAVWRWHFYAGFLCVPLVIWLALTGSIYLWRPQIETWLDRPYDHLATEGPAASPDAQVVAALQAVPGSTLHDYILPRASGQAVRILVSRNGTDTRVYVNPRSLAVLKTEAEERRPFQVISHLHGELLAGSLGSYLVEIAACWTIVMLLTGLFLWWPRGRRGLAGVLYPRLYLRGRMFWRDIHATAGLWVSLFALGLILTGLPWAQGWGSYLVEIRSLTGTGDGPVDWAIGGKTPEADPLVGTHVGHTGMTMPTPPIRAGQLALVIQTVRPLMVAAPVLISPPSAPDAPWTVASDAADRPLRSDLKVDGASGRLVSRIDFARKHWLDRTIGYGVAAHEGALFGLANQILGSLTALFLVVLSVSGTIMWWRRRLVGLLGAPLSASQARFGSGLVVAIVALAIYLPMFGLTLGAVLIVERTILRHSPAARQWLGLGTSSGPS